MSCAEAEFSESYSKHPSQPDSPIPTGSTHTISLDSFLSA